MTLSSFIDHTLLKPDATEAQIARLCAEAEEYGFAAVCVQPCWVSFAKKQLKKVKLCSVVGFPHGANDPRAKAFEASLLDVDEIDMVINVGFLKSKRYDQVREDIEGVVRSCKFVKVILETCLLDEEEKRLACTLALEAGAHFVKTSTGFASGGATVGDIQLMKEVVGQKMGIKASGGIGDRTFALALIQAGATRIGTSKGPFLI